MNIRTFLIFLFLAASVHLMQAQQKLVLDLEGAKKYALEYNKSLKNSQLATSKSEMAVKEAIANGLPQLNATMDYSNALGASISIRFNPDMPASEIPIKPQSNLNLTLGQLLFNGNYILGVQTAKLYADITQKSHKRTELEVLAQVSDGYYLVLMSEEMLNILKQNVVNLEKLVEKMTVMEQVGIIEKTEIDQLSVQLNTLKNTVKSSERQLELATNMLRLQIGASVDTEIELSESLPNIMEATSFEGTLLNSFNLEGNIDYQLMEQQVAVSRKMVDMQRANALPTLSAFYRYTYKLLKPDFDMTPPNMVGLQMNIPIFSSGVRIAQVKQAGIDLKTIENNRDLLSDQLRIQEKQLRYNFTSALETWQNQQKNVEVSRRVYANLKLKYEQGLISGLDLVTADNNFLRAESDYLSAIMQVLSTRVQLEKLYGTIR